MDIAGKGNILPFPTILTFGNSGTHVGASNSDEMTFDIE